MTVKECYDAMGANYDEVLTRLRSDERVRKFLVRLPQDPTYEQMRTALAERNVEEAFRGAHTLKGVCQNLALTRLYQSAATLCDALRGKQTYDPACEPLLKAVEEDYEAAMKTIAQLA